MGMTKELTEFDLYLDDYGLVFINNKKGMTTGKVYTGKGYALLQTAILSEIEKGQTALLFRQNDGLIIVRATSDDGDFPKFEKDLKSGLCNMEDYFEDWRELVC